MKCRDCMGEGWKAVVADWASIKDGRIFVLRGVDASECTQCGNQVISSHTMKAIERARERGANPEVLEVDVFYLKAQPVGTFTTSGTVLPPVT